MVRWFTRRPLNTDRRSTRRPSRSRLLVQGLEQRLAPAVFTVTTEVDGVGGSLRDAITQANATPGVDDIVFGAGITSATPIFLALGELTITDSVNVTGTSPANILIDGGGITRLFKVDNSSTSQITVNFKNLTMQFGNATTALTPANNDGGAIGITDESVTVDNCIFKNNQAVEGGAISVNSAGARLTITNSTFENNNAVGGTTPTQGGDGGAINIEANNFVLSVSTTTIRANNAIDDGGGIYLFGRGDLTIERSTISGNAANSSYTADGNPNGGGALYWYGSVNTAAVVRNSTIAGNISQDDGGGFALRLVGGLTVQNSTITGNQAGGSSTSSGGGFYIYGGRAPLTLSSTIVSGNFDGEVPDIWSNGSVTASHSAIGDPIGFRLTDAGNNLPFRANLGLGALTNNGGPTETILPDPGSPLYNRGVSNGLPVDQRGNPRVAGVQADIGATEAPLTTIPLANISIPAPTLGATTWTITVVYSDEISIDSTTIGIDDLSLSGPGVTFGSPITASAGITAAVVTAIYTFVAPDSGTAGVWDVNDAGAYTITLGFGQVSDTAANAVVGGVLAEARVGFARTFSVTSAAPTGPGTLEEAVLLANAAPYSTNTITFDAGVFGGAQTISLAGPLNVTNPLVVTGPGASKLTVLGNGRIFVIDNYGPVDFSLSDMTLTGASTTGRGGAVYAFDDPISITNCVITGNTADNDGAGAAQAIGNVFNITNTQITNNKSLGSGGDAGGVFTRFGATLTITGSNISGNSSFFSGAGVYSRNDKVTIVDTTISGNVNIGTTNVNAGGGGLYINATLGLADVTIRNSTISDNITARNGGGILFRNGTNYSKFVVQNTTIAGNRSLSTNTTPGNSAGGLSITGLGSMTTSFESSILAGNVAGSFADLSLTTSNPLAATKTAIGSSVGGTLIDNGGNLIGATLNLGSLGTNGGSSPTRLPAAGSPLINAGSNPSGLGNDQRGAGFPRNSSGGVDIGATESGTTPVAVTGPYADILLDGGTSYDVSVTYIDDVAILVSSINGSDVTVTGPNGFSTTATVKTSPMPGDGSPRSVVYTFNAPGGTWDSGDNGIYSINIGTNQVTDTSGNAVGAGLLGYLRVAIPAPIVVTTTTDAIVTKAGDAPGTLRQAIFDSNANPGTDTILFDPNVFVNNMGQPTAILLTEGRLAVVDNIIIQGLGADRVAIDGTNNLSRRGITFSDSIVGKHLVADVSKVTFQNFLSGDATGANDGISNGGAILIADEWVTFTDVNFVNNTSAATGGAIHVLRSGANLTLTRTNFTANSALGGSTTDGGGAVRMAQAAHLTVTDSNFEANSTPAGTGGAIIGINSGVLIERSSFIGNSNNQGNGSAFGGGLMLLGSAPAFGWTIRNSTFFGNKSGGRGGAIGISNFGSLNLGGAINLGTTLTIQNSTITGNSAGLANNGASPGAGIGAQYIGSVLNLESSIVSGNVRVASGVPIAADIGLSNATGSRVLARNSAIGSLNNIASAATPGFDFVDLGNNLIGAALNLETAPAFNGGLTQTIKFAGPSPAIDAGSNPAGASTDQTGATRTFSVRPDIGAYESTTVQDLPRAFVNLPGDVTVNNNGTFDITVDYYDATGISIPTIDLNDIVYFKFVASPGVPTPISPTSVTTSGTGSKVTATYTFPVPVGGFNNAANGQYVVQLKANQVSDGTNFVTTADTTAGVFRCAVGTTFTVTTNTDAAVTKAGDAPGTLRQAIFDANASLGTDTVLFNFGGATTIGLTAGELVVSDAVVIQGQSAANSVVNQTAAAGRVFRVSGPGVFTVTFDSLTIQGGKTPGSGGTQGTGILLLDESVIVSNSVIRNNSTTTSGGGISVQEAGSLTLINSTVQNNTASGINGGGIFVNRNGGSVSITNSTISGNTAAAGNGGGIYSVFGGGVTVLGSTLSGNSAALTGGGIGFTNRGNLTVRNSTISGNTATTGAGLALANYFLGTALVQNSTITGNVATSLSTIRGDGGAVAWNTGAAATTSNFSSLDFASSIVAGNTSANYPDISTNSPMSANNSLIGVADVGFTLTGSANLTGTFASPLDPQLEALAINGGPTATHALKVTSPAIDAGFNPAGLTTDQRGPGFARSSGPAVDIGAFELQLAAPPSKFSNLLINNGAVQRSRVLTVRVNFDSPVAFVGSPAAAFELRRNSDNAPVTLAAAFTPGDSFVTLTFTGGAVEGQAGNFSLADGRYTLTLLANQFAGNGFDGNGNGTAEGSPVDNLAIASAAAPSLPTNIWRLYGDADASGQVDSNDFLGFRLAFLQPSDAFDADGSGIVDSNDFLRFRLNFLATLP